MKPNLLLLHGALGSEDQFAPLLPLLAAHFNLYHFNFSGHGGIYSPGAFSMDRFAEEVKSFIESKNLQSVNVFGYSMGGYVALTLARRDPQLLAKILTLGTKFNWTPETAAQEVKMLNPEKIEEKVPAFAQQLATVHDPLDWKTVMQQTAQMMLDLGNGNARLEDSDWPQIPNSVCINLGSEDRMVSPEESEHVAQLLPNAQYQLIEGFPHPIDRVDMPTLAQRILDFLP